MDEDIIYSGPLGHVAQQLARPAGTDPSDVYAAAVSWWSAAIAPAVSLSMRPSAPLSVWTTFVESNGHGLPPLQDVLRPALQAPAPLLTHHDVSDVQLFGSAGHTTRRAGRMGRAVSTLLLTGSPFRQSRGRPTISLSLEAHLRRAWDGQDRLPSRGKRRNRLYGAPAPPHVGVLWEVALDEWKTFRSTDAATYSRTLHFSRRATLEAVPDASDAPEKDWQQLLADAYTWAFQTKFVLTCTPRAGAKWDAIREAENVWFAVLPEHEAGFFVRTGDHVSRIAGTLAATECTAIHGRHIDAAWSLVRRSILDTLQLNAVRLEKVLPVVTRLNGAVFGVTGPEGTAPPFYPDGASPYRSASGSENPILPAFRRNVSSTKLLKQWYEDRCQMCREVLVLPAPLNRYSEGAHIRARGDGGPDTVENLLCLCPNCHVLFDFGARALTDDLRIIDTVTGTHLGQLNVHRWHRIDVRFIRHHRRRWHE